MSDLGDRMEKIFGGGAPSGEAPSPREIAQSLREHFGSGRKAAAAMGVNESVFRRLVSGKTASPKGGTVDALERAGRSLSARKIGLGDIRLPVTPTKNGERSARDRELTAKNLRISDPAAADRIRAEYVKGGQEAAAAQLIRETKDQHYRNWLVPDELIEQVYDTEGSEDYGYAVG